MTGNKRGLRVIARGKPTARTRAGDKIRRVMRELEGSDQLNSSTDPIVEQLKQCPEAFKAGEMVGKLFDAVKYGQNGRAGGNRHLPPAGTVLPLV